MALPNEDLMHEQILLKTNFTLQKFISPIPIFKVKTTNWWRRGRVELPVQKVLYQDMLQAYLDFNLAFTTPTSKVVRESQSIKSYVQQY